MKLCTLVPFNDNVTIFIFKFEVSGIIERCKMVQLGHSHCCVDVFPAHSIVRFDFKCFVTENYLKMKIKLLTILWILPSVSSTITCKGTRKYTAGKNGGNVSNIYYDI